MGTKFQNFSKLHRIQFESLLRIGVSLACICGLLVSKNLWFDQRLFPATPFLSFLKPIPSSTSFVLYAAMLILLLGISFHSKFRTWIVIFIGIASIEILLDRSRLQPWFYQYLLFLLAFVQTTSDPIKICTWIQGGAYFWSGISKMNDSFVHEVFPWLLSSFGQTASSFTFFGYAAPFLESTLGIFLIIGIFPGYTLVLGCLMHLFILFAIGPFGHHWNTVVWPWNLALFFFLLIYRYQDQTDAKKGLYFYIAALMTWILPSLNFFSYWDSYPSFSLYSGNLKHASYFLKKDLYQNLDSRLKKYGVKEETDLYRFNLMAWSMDELNVPPYPEPILYRTIGKKLCLFAPSSDGLFMELYFPSHWFQLGKKLELYRCDSL